MGWGGCIGIMNASPYTMTPSDVSSYQMKSWSFPDKLLPGSVNKFYVEYDEGIFVTESDTAAKVVFELDNPSKTKFEFHSEHLGGQGRNIFVQPSGLQQAGPGNTDNRIDLGFVHDSCVGFYISGEEGSLHANNPPKDWMHSTLNVIGDKTLRDISLPGAHDAGMGPDFKAGTFGSDTANTKTQALTIGGQLDQGARWFDIRPVIGDGGKWLTGHYSGGPHSLGGNGEPIDNIINDINAFTAQNNELIILELSHAVNSDDSYRDLTQDEWNTLFSKLTSSLKHLHTPATSDLSAVKISDYIKNSASVLIVARTQDGITLGDFDTKGIHPGSSFAVYNEYSDSSNLDKVTSDQVDKLGKWRTYEPDKNVFLLSWTETETGIDNVFGNGIEANALEVNSRLFDKVAPQVGKDKVPNIIMEDYVKTNDVASFSMAINWMQAKVWSKGGSKVKVRGQRWRA